MNPIKGIWYNLKDRVNEVTSTNKRDLIERIINVWYHKADITQLIAKYFETKPNRIAALIKSMGGVTKYWH